MTALQELGSGENIKRRPRIKVWRKVGIAAMALAVSGCSSLGLNNALYLHSDTEEKLTADAVTALEMGRTEHLKMIDDQAALLTTSSARIQQYVFDAEIAQRDAFLAVFLDKLDLNGGGATLTAAQQRETNDALLIEIEERVHQLLGVNYNKDDLPQLVIESMFAKDKAQALKNQRVSYERSLDAFSKLPNAIVKNRTCNLMTMPELDGTNLLTEEVFKSCRLVQGLLREVEPSERHPVFFSVISDSATGGALEVLNAEINHLEAAIKLRDEIVEEVNKALIKAQQELKDAANDQSAAEAAETKLKNVACALSKLAAGKLASTEAPPTDPEAEETCGQQSFNDVADLIADGDLGLDTDKEKVLNSKLKPLLQAAFRARKAEATEASLVDLFDEIAAIDPEGEIEQNGELASRIQATVRAFGILSDFTNAGKTPGANALAITAAGQAFVAQSARADAAQLKEQSRLLKLKQTAMSNEVVQLAFSYTAIEDQDAIRALRHYTESWNQGRIQQRLISYLEFDQERSTWLSRERLATEARYAVLKPALDELAVFGAGGIEPELIARYLELIGISAIAVGTN